MATKDKIYIRGKREEWITQDEMANRIGWSAPTLRERMRNHKLTIKKSEKDKRKVLINLGEAADAAGVTILAKGSTNNPAERKNICDTCWVSIKDDGKAIFCRDIFCKYRGKYRK